MSNLAPQLVQKPWNYWNIPPLRCAATRRGVTADHHMTTPSALVSKLWNYCNILRDDGLSCGDYAEQLTFLLFLKMANEQARPPFNNPSAVPKGFGWDVLIKLNGDDLETHYRRTPGPGKRKGMLGKVAQRVQESYQEGRAR